MDYSFFFTYYSILIFSPIILFTSPIILNYAQSKQVYNSSLRNVYTTLYRESETLRRLQTMYTNIRNDIYFLLIMSIMLE